MKIFRRNKPQPVEAPVQPERRVNRFKEETPEQDSPETLETPETPTPKPKNNSAWANNVRDLLSGEFLIREGALVHIPFIAFLSALLILYVSLGYYYEHLERERQTTERRLEELRSEYKTLQAEFETQLQQSQVEQSMAALGLIQPVDPPYLIEVKPVESSIQ